jgi:hypothetical protein
VVFLLLHNILPLKIHRHSLCCPEHPEDAAHFFTACCCISATWSFLVLLVALLIGAPVADCPLLMFAWPPCTTDGAIALAVATYVEFAWSARDNPGTLWSILVRARVDLVAAEKGVSSIFPC